VITSPQNLKIRYVGGEHWGYLRDDERIYCSGRPEDLRMQCPSAFEEGALPPQPELIDSLTEEPAKKKRGRPKKTTPAA
jgi:hypothetical protein